jgi:transposase
MDNLGAHRPERIRELIEARGAELVFVPSYSPDLNPSMSRMLWVWFLCYLKSVHGEVAP